MGKTGHIAGADEDPPLGADEIEALEALRYKTEHLARLLSHQDVNRERRFWHHLVRLARPTALAYDAIMMAHGGKPVGTEYRNVDRQAWAVLHEHVAPEGVWRVTHFEACGFTGHESYPTIEAGVYAMARDGYRLIDSGVLDALSQTRSWERGTRIAALISRLSAREITMAEYAAMLAEADAGGEEPSTEGR